MNEENNVTANEVMTGSNSLEQVVQETPNFTILQLPNGKYKKMMKYEKYFSKVPETEEEQLTLFKVFNADQDSGLVTSLSDVVGKEFHIEQVFFNPYQSFDEENGTFSNGVTTTMLSTDGEFFATSSKSVYYTLHNIFEAFGYPNTENYKPVKVEVTSKKMSRGNQINLDLKGRE